MMKFDPYAYPHPSRRKMVYAKRGMAACTHPVAAEAGLRMLQRGGNAVDAAVAMAATLTVVEPASNGIGGDNFALVWQDGKLHGLNASGPMPRGLSFERCVARGKGAMPRLGWEPVTVPGAPAGWRALSRRFGRLPYADLFVPAIEAAREGYAVTADQVSGWKRAAALYRDELGALADPWLEAFTRDGAPYVPGDVLRLPGHARALEAIAATESEAFYRGDIAVALADFAARTGGYITQEDLAAYTPEWVEPVRVDYRGYDVWELPPNGQGIVALMALGILRGYDFPASGFGAEETLHRQMEAVKYAFADAKAYLADPAHMTVSVGALLSPAYAASRRALIGEESADPHPGTPPSGGTVYFAAADGEGGMVSMIQSNYLGFGSGLVLPGWGISLHNRGFCFTLEAGHPNAPAPGKRPYHTIIPGFLTRGGKAIGPFGVMGGYMQPQGHVQVIMNTVDFAMNPQAALDAPRFCWTQGRELLVDAAYNPAVLAALERRGHKLRLSSTDMGNPFGRGQIIWRTSEGTLCGGTEPRGEGTIYAY